MLKETLVGCLKSFVGKIQANNYDKNKKVSDL
jgi:hypothetical protein